MRRGRGCGKRRRDAGRDPIHKELAEDRPLRLRVGGDGLAADLERRDGGKGGAVAFVAVAELSPTSKGETTRPSSFVATCAMSVSFRGRRREVPSDAIARKLCATLPPIH